MSYDAHRMLDALLSDLDDRRGFDVESCDPAVVQDWRTHWLAIIREHMALQLAAAMIAEKRRREGAML